MERLRRIILECEIKVGYKRYKIKSVSYLTFDTSDGELYLEFKDDNNQVHYLKSRYDVFILIYNSTSYNGNTLHKYFK